MLNVIEKGESEGRRERGREAGWREGRTYEGNKVEREEDR